MKTHLRRMSESSSLSISSAQAGKLDLPKLVRRTSSLIAEDNRYAEEQEKARPASLDYGASLYEADMSGDDGSIVENDTPPDGTFWGWMTCAGVLLINVFSYGTNSVFGIFLEYYMESNHFPGATDTQYALIGGLCLGVGFMIISVSNTLIRRFPYRVTMAIGSFWVIVCFVGASFAKTIVQLIMLQGFLMPIGFSLVAGPTFIMIPSWFLKRRALAQGIGSAGAGLGGLIFAKPVEILIQRDNNYKWALRMLGIVCGTMLLVATALVRTRRPVRVKHESLFKDILHNFARYDIYLDPPMLCIIVWNAIFGISFSVLLFSFSSYSTAIGLTRSQGSIVTLLQSAAQMVGRPAIGYLSDTYGRANITIIMTVILGILVICWWVFIHNFVQLCIFGFFSGLLMGIGWTNFAPLTADVVGTPDRLLAATSMLTFIGGPPQICGEIIALKLRRSNATQPFLYAQILVAVCCFVSAAFLLPLRAYKVSKVLLGRDRGVLTEQSLRGHILRCLYPIKV